MPLSKNQWQAFEEALQVPCISHKLMCDGYEITVQVQIMKGMKLVVAVFVDGEIKGSWLNGKDERCLKFYRKITKYLLKPAERKAALKASQNRRLCKTDRDYFKENAEKTFEYWLPYWSTAWAFGRHIRKTCQSIEVIE